MSALCSALAHVRGGLPVRIGTHLEILASVVTGRNISDVEGTTSTSAASGTSASEAATGSYGSDQTLRAVHDRHEHPVTPLPGLF